VDVPKLHDHFILNSPMLLLHIESAPALEGLSFHEPLPANAVLNGVQNLQFFSAGGPNCTDAIVNEVLNCTGLQRLTLAYTNLLPATLKRIAELRDLKYLVLTGSKIDSEFVESLSSLNNLRTLRLNHTPIDRQSISAISKFKDLEVLDLGELRLTSEDVTQIASSLTKLNQVSLIGAELTAENMRQLAKLNELKLLDLSKCALNDELLNAFAESPPPQLVEFRVNSAQLGEIGFQNLVRKLPALRFALNDTDINPQIMDKLVMQQRVTEMDTELGGMGTRTRFYSAIPYGMPGMPFGTPESGQGIGTPHFSDIDPNRFAPDYKDPLAEYENRKEAGSTLGSMDMMNEGLGAQPVSPLGPPMNPLETLGYQLFKLLDSR
jgi:hypothetical protein